MMDERWSCARTLYPGHWLHLSSLLSSDILDLVLLGEYKIAIVKQYLQLMFRIYHGIVVYRETINQEQLLPVSTSFEMINRCSEISSYFLPKRSILLTTMVFLLFILLSNYL